MTVLKWISIHRKSENHFSGTLFFPSHLPGKSQHVCVIFPWNKAVSANVGKKFLQLVDKHFLKGSKWRALSRYHIVAQETWQPISLAKTRSCCGTSRERSRVRGLAHQRMTHAHSVESTAKNAGPPTWTLQLTNSQFLPKTPMYITQTPYSDKFSGKNYPSFHQALP